MIVKDQHGKEVNATKFTVEINRTCCGVKIPPEAILKGHYSYVSLKARKTNIVSVLNKLPYNNENVCKLLDMKESFEEQCRNISSQMHKEVGDLSLSIQSGKEQEWLVKNGYMLWEKDEIHFPTTEEEAMNWVMKGCIFGKGKLQEDENWPGNNLDTVSEDNVLGI